MKTSEPTPSMNKPNDLFKGSAVKSLVLPAVLGASAPLALLLFIILTREDVLESWMLAPLTLIPLAGALGGVIFYLMGFVWFPGGKQKLIAILFSTVFYFVALCMAAVFVFSFTGRFD